MVATIHIKWEKMSAGVKDYEDRTYEWWGQRLHTLASERKWCAVFVVLTMLQESGALSKVDAIYRLSGENSPPIAQVATTTTRRAKTLPLAARYLKK